MFVHVFLLELWDNFYKIEQEFITSLSICVSLIDLDLDLDLVFGEMQETCIFHYVFFCFFEKFYEWYYVAFISTYVTVVKGLKRICWQIFPGLLQDIVFFETDLAKLSKMKIINI